MNRLTGASIAALLLILGAIPITAYAVGDGEQASHHARHPRDKDVSAEKSAAGKAHAEAMRKWARCVAEHAQEDRPPGVRPKDLCPPKPVPPGRAKHGHGPAGSHGKDGKTR